VYLFHYSSTCDERPIDDNKSVPLSIAHTSNIVIINMERRFLADVDGLQWQTQAYETKGNLNNSTTSLAVCTGVVVLLYMVCVRCCKCCFFRYY
jgi:hypothetical protein